ncbi:MAG TPA: hypothetical protein VK479_03165 [Micropepsaceae bacterium]|nr:hypothetical protein [Micropepsaceae bacterium]
MSDEIFGDVFSQQHDPADDGAAADGTLPPGAGGVIIMYGDKLNSEEFETRFGGPRVLEPVEFENADDATVTRGDPLQQERADADAKTRGPIIAAAQELGPDLRPTATSEQIEDRAEQFKRAIARHKALAAAVTE